MWEELVLAYMELRLDNDSSMILITKIISKTITFTHTYMFILRELNNFFLYLSTGIIMKIIMLNNALQTP